MNFGNVSLDNGVGRLISINTPATLFNFLWDLLFGIGLAVSLIFVIIAGIKFVTSSGDENKFNEAKEALIYAVVGAIVVIGFTVILNIVLSVFGSQGVEKYLEEDGGVSPSIVLQDGDYTRAVDGSVLADIGSSFTVLFFALRNVSLALALIFILVAGIKFATSAGNPDKIAEAKQTITWAVAGAVLAIFFYSFLYMIAHTFGLQGVDSGGLIKILPPDFFNNTTSP